jgi:hypothetical protein
VLVVIIEGLLAGGGPIRTPTKRDDRSAMVDMPTS